MDRAGPR